jgi:MFS family permease
MGGCRGHHLWQLILLWGVVVGLGTGLTALVLAATISVRWFHTHRGLIVGLLTSSSATGQLIFLPLLASVSRTRTFWILFATFFICGASTNGLIQTHFIPFCSDNGLSEITAAGVLATMGVLDFAGTIASGWLSDRFTVAPRLTVAPGRLIPQDSRSRT